MPDTKISAATETTPAGSDYLPLARPNDTTARAARLGYVTGLGGASELTSAVSASATSLSVRGLPAGAAANMGWFIIDPYTVQCEIRKVKTISTLTCTVDALAFAHAAGDAVLWTTEPMCNVKLFGALGNGTTDDTAALQAAIDASISTGAYASVTRQGFFTLYIPVGLYLITSPLRVRSVLDWRMVGEGSQSVIRASGALECALDLNGVAYSQVENFAFDGAAGATVTRAVWLRKTGVNRSTTRNTLQNILVRDLVFTEAGFTFGDTDTCTAQVDNSTVVNCIVNGGWVTPEATNYQNGFLVGCGTFSNNLQHNFYGCAGVNVRYGLHVNACEALWLGGVLAGCENDILAAVTSYLKVAGIRSEDSERLLVTGGPASYPAHISLEDINWRCNALNADTQAIQWKLGGTLRLANVQFAYTAGHLPIIKGSSGVPWTAILEGVTSANPLGTFLNLGATARAVVLAYNQVDTDGGMSLPVEYIVQVGVTATVDLPAASTGLNGRVLVEDAGAGDRNLIVYAGGQRFRIDGGVAF